MTTQPSSEYLAKPSSNCCLTGHLHTGTPTGHFQNITGIKTYISIPSPSTSNGNIVLYFADVFGLFPNAQLIMDAFASAGYLTLGLDYFLDDPVTRHRNSDGVWTDRDVTFEEWKAKYTAYANENVPRWIEAVKREHGAPAAKYACVGYCFGAPYVCDSLAGENPACDVGAFAHPAFLKERHFRNLRRPLFLSCAETDHTFGTEERNRAVEMLREDGRQYQVQLFSGVKHGFALRCDMGDPYQVWVKEKSLEGLWAGLIFGLGWALSVERDTFEY